MGGLKIIATLDSLKDAGHLDILDRYPGLTGTLRALVRNAKQAWEAASQLPETFHTPYEIDNVNDGRKLDSFDAVVSSGCNVKPLFGGHGVISSYSQRPW
jgi:hypothetical protein